MCFILKSFSRTLGKNSLIVARRECAPWQPQEGIGDDREKVPSCHGTAHLLLWGKISPPTPRGLFLLHCRWAVGTQRDMPTRAWVEWCKAFWCETAAEPNTAKNGLRDLFLQIVTGQAPLKAHPHVQEVR